MKNRTTLLLLLLLAFLTPLNAQPLSRIEHYSIDHGLAQGVIMGIAQDAKGYMWFSTWNGLNKFDGYTFQTFKAKSGDGCTLDDNRIEYIASGKYNRIWCRTYDLKAYIFCPETETFTDVLKSVPPKEAQVRRLTTFKNGVIWLICDYASCFRFDETAYKDSAKFEQYSIAKKNIRGDTIYNIVQDSGLDEWILTNKGATIVGKKQIRSNLPFCHLREVNGEIWLATLDGQLARYDKRTGNVHTIPLPIPSVEISALREIGHSTLAIGTQKHGLLLYDISRESFQTIDLRTPRQPSNEVQTLYTDQKDILWISTASFGVTQWNHAQQKLSYLPPLPSRYTEEKYNKVYFIFEDCQDRLWVQPKGGSLNLYDREHDRLQSFHDQTDDDRFALNTSTHTYFPDRQGNLWLNTSSRELEKISLLQTPYTISDLGIETRAFLYDRAGRLWVATKDQKVRIYDAKGKLIGYLTKQGQVASSENFFKANVYCIKQLADGSIWLGTRGDGLFILRQKGHDAKQYEVEPYKHDPSQPYSISNNDIYSILEDSRKNIWIGCFGGGINLVRPATGKDLQFIHSGNQLPFYPHADFSKVRCLAETAEGIIMVGTTKGLVCFSSTFQTPDQIRFYTHIRDPNDASSLSNNNVIYIYTTRKREVYISTLGGGVNKIVSSPLTPDQMTFKSYSKKSGLPFDWVLSTIEDAKGNLWFISENTLSKFNPRTEQFDNYSRDFLKHKSFYSEALPVINSQGELFIGTSTGFMELPIAQLRKSQYVPPIVLTNIKILNDSRPIPCNDLSEFTLTPRQRNITVEFAALDYVNPENIRYAYKLNGVDSDWNYVGRKRSANYINLPHGTYNLLIKSTNSDGVWTDNTYTLTIHVTPKFRETVWAWMLYTFILTLFIVTVVYILFYIYRLRHRVNVEQQIANIKLHFFTDISHELRTPLTLINGPVTEVLQNEELSSKAKEYLGIVQKNTERMLRLVNQILDFRKIQNKKMKLLVEETDIVAWLPTVVEHFKVIAEEKNIDLKIETGCNRSLLWIDTDKFEKIFFNLLSNAFKYTPNDKAILLKIESAEDSVYISVIDQGEGISENKLETIFQRFETIIHRNMLEPSSGIGLSLVKELVAIHHGDISVSSEIGKGSRFTVRMLKGKAHFMQDKQTEFILSDMSEAVITPLDNEVTNASEEENEEKLSILIVEDNLELRRFLADILSKEYHIIEASNGQEGYEQAQQAYPCIILSDVMMPVMDGLDMVKAIKGNREICHIPIVLLSAKSSLDDRIKGLEYGIDDYLTKPFSTNYLKARITSLLKQRKLLQENYRLTLLSNQPMPGSLDLSPSSPQVIPYDQNFIEQVMNIIEENMSNSELTIDEIANAVAMGRTAFYKKVKAVIGISPINLISEIRIKRAIQLFDGGEPNIAQVAFMTGFNDPKYFSRCFKKQTGVTPSQYKEQKG